MKSPYYHTTGKNDLAFLVGLNPKLINKMMNSFVFINVQFVFFKKTGIEMNINTKLGAKNQVSR
jgi:hypothetical protein